MSSSRLPLWVLGSIVVLPPLVVSSYLSLPYYKASQQELEPYKPTYTVLSLPTLDTKKLPLHATELSLNRLKEPAENMNSIEEFGGVSNSKDNNDIEKLTAEQNQEPLDIDNLDLSGLSPELAARFTSILNEPSEIEEQYENESAKYGDSPYVELDKKGTQFSGQLPALNFQTHNYTSKPSLRWVKVNGKEVNLGGHISNGITLLEINPRNVVIDFKGQKIGIPALYEWKG
ncbi:general secretion pathway protein GspB [Aliivibrio sp. S3MY1]|uniref:general secretion pathway protein GspB n=1 Tax=unclassified Aliivibrio TaxID=2645654 RepID=UPI002378C8B9|nr:MULTISPECIES: general secretion pathway protein GspB [unclassified Aliivibrio]MDD9195219.1 general secretion pathway protein GspB [Aliivibrio sp. S3MY1]MDD9197784.1 general secretion pathway protein GspB [Aliivibrio sp. S2MY1]